MSTLRFQIVTDNLDTPWAVSVSDNEKVFFDQKLTTATTAVEYQFADEDGSHNISIKISGKRDQDTTIDEHNNIVKDSVLHISNFELDDIAIDTLLHKEAVYQHNFNGHGNPTQSQFYGTVGCNGSIEFAFTSPIYIWLLEKM